MQQLVTVTCCTPGKRFWLRPDPTWRRTACMEAHHAENRTRAKLVTIKSIVIGLVHGLSILIEIDWLSCDDNRLIR